MNEPSNPVQDNASAARVLPSAAAAAPLPSSAAAVAPPGEPTPGPRLWWAAAVVLLLLVAGSLAMAWRAEQRVLSLEQELVLRQQNSAGQSAEARMLAKQAQEGMREGAAKLALLEARVAEVAIQRGQLEDLIQSLSRSRDENLIVDVEAGIRVALQQNAITGSAEPLMATLRQSDERLARYNQPRLEGVRRAIARDLDRVKAISVTDISTLSIKLDEAVRMVDELPLLAAAELRKDSAKPAPSTSSAAATSAASAAALKAARPASAPVPSALAWPAAIANAWDTLTQRVWLETRSLVRVTRIDHPEAMLLAPEQAFFLKENLKLRLLNARLALLSRQFETAQNDLASAQASLERYFDKGARRTVLATELVRQVAAQARQVGVPRPDDTLAALAAAAAGR